MPGGAAAAVAGVSSAVGATVGTWQRFDAVVIELQAACSPAALQTFFHGWDQHGGGLCTSMRQHVCALLQADPVAWQEVHLTAEALQELCWEQLHTGHWMDVAVEWRDAYCLYTVLTVVAMLSRQQHTTLHASPQHHQQQQQDPQPAPHPTSAAAEQPGPAAAAAGAPNTVGQEQTSKAAAAGPSCSAADAQAMQQQLLREGLRQLDMAALMGGLRFRPWVDKLIDVLDCQLQDLGDATTPASTGSLLTQAALGSGGEVASMAAPAAPGGIKRKAGDSEGVLGGGGFGGQASQLAGSGADAAGGGVSVSDAEPRHKQLKSTPHHQQQDEHHYQQQEQQQQQPSGRGPAPQVALPPGSLSSGSAVVPLHQAPSMEHFLVNCLLTEGGPQPAVLRGVMDSWPATTRWQDMDYLRRVAGRRTVPVEVGSHYLEEGWGTRLMTLGDFIAAMGAAQGPNAGSTGHAAAEVAPEQQQQQEGQPAPLLYLAQHQLFEQVPALASDILTPDYCMLGSQGVSSVNAWFGPAGTVTPLHQDPEHNLLAQVVGRKYVRLYDPAHTPQLYPHASGMHTNTSRVDLHRVDEQQYPGFSTVPYVDVVLEPGDMLYMPPKWWHFVQSLSLSFSVSFWWS